MTIETDPHQPDLVEVILLPGRILVQIDPSVPRGRVKPVVQVAGLRRDLEGRQQASAAGISYDFDFALVPAGARLQLWVEGRRLYDRALPDAASRLVGAVEGVSDYAVIGWVADVLGGKLPAGILTVDGADVAALPAPALRHRLNHASDQAACAGFRAALPISCLDGATHRIGVRFGALRLPELTWQARPQFHVEMAQPDEIRLWFVDPALLDDPVTISVCVAGTVVAQGRTMPRVESPPVPGRLHADFVLRLARPLPPGEVGLRAGGDGPLAFATLFGADLSSTVAAMRQVASGLLALEQRFGRPLGWSRDMLARLRREALLPAPGLQPLHLIRRQAPTPIRVIVPVYKGVVETRACLAALRDACLAEAHGIGAVLVVNDCSPETAMMETLAESAGVWGGVRFDILSNPENLGFVGSVNRALAAADGFDVILLNADTVVPPGFAARLRDAAHRRADIASATPLSNDATILSLPDRAGGNEMDVATAMALNAALAGEAAIDVPVGVGFCLYLKAAALADVGMLGAEWQRGYCEEVDWCLRAADRGWRHVAACDTLVFHHGTVSFGAAERSVILARNHAVLERHYPDYVPQIQAFLRDDPLWRLRLRVFVDLLAPMPRLCVLHFSHGLGGGTEVLVRRLAGVLAAEGVCNLICTGGPDAWLGAPVLVVTCHDTGMTLRLPMHGLAEMMAALMGSALPELRLVVHSLLGIGAEIHDVAQSLGLQVCIYLHDYQWYCPRVVLVDASGRYCGEPEIVACQRCVRDNRVYDFGADALAIQRDLPGWIGRNLAALQQAARVIAPSRDTADRYAARLGLDNIAVLSHPEPVTRGRIRRGPDAAAVTRVAVVGGISVQKGRDVLGDLGRLADRTGAPLAIRVIGDVEDPGRLQGIASIEIAGRYAPSDLAGLLAEFDPHFVLLPAVWPETYSFVLSEVWAAGYPVVCFDIGAIAERVHQTGAGVVLPFVAEPSVLLPRLLAARAAVGALAGLEVEVGRMPEGLVERLFYS